MLYYPLDEIKVGMVLGRSIISDKGDLLLARGEILNERYLNRVRDLGFNGLYIVLEGTEHVQPTSKLSDKIDIQANSILRESVEVIEEMSKTQKEGLSQLKEFTKNKNNFKHIRLPAKIKDVVYNIIEDILIDEDSILNLSIIKNSNKKFFQSAIDVAIISTMLGIKFKFNKQELLDLSTGALLHDIGMSIIPASISNSSRRLSMEELNLLKEHTHYGFEILKNNPQLSLLAAHVALQHHERQNGSGYPRGLSGENISPAKRIQYNGKNIHKYAEIVAVADYYIDQTSEKIGHKQPADVMKMLIKLSGSYFNSNVVREFVRMTPVFPVGALIVIVDSENSHFIGHRGVVSEIHQDNINRPQIILIMDSKKKKISPPITIDMRYENDIKIKIII